MKSDNVINYWISGRYKNKPKIKNWINATGLQIQGQSDFYKDLTYNIDNSYNALLDVIGRVIGVPRLELPRDLQFFGYYKTPLAVGYGIAPYYDFESIPESHPIPDEYYKLVLKFKVLLNTSDCTRKSIIRATKTLFSVSDIRLIDNEDMEFKIVINESVDEVLIYVMNEYKLYIKPAGVKFLGYEVNYNEN